MLALLQQKWSIPNRAGPTVYEYLNYVPSKILSTLGDLHSSNVTGTVVSSLGMLGTPKI